MTDGAPPASTPPCDATAFAGLCAAAAAALATLRVVVNWVCIALLCAMICLIMFQILGRYVFNYSISWSEEAAIFVQIWMVMLGAGIAMRNRHHAGVDIVIARCPRPLAVLIKSAAALLVAWFLIVVIVSSFALIGFGLIVSSTALQLPLAVPYAAMPVGLSYFLLEFAIATLPDIRGKAAPVAAEVRQ